MAKTILKKPKIKALLLRGLVREQKHWGDFVKYWREVLPEHEVHLLDLPGIGTERRRASPFTIEAITDDIRNRWLKLKKDDDDCWILFTLSLGSMVALDWASRYPEDFKQITIMNTSAANTSPVWKRLKLRNLPNIIKVALEKNAFKKEMQILKLTTNLLENPEALAQTWSKHVLPKNRMRALALAQLLAALRFRAPRFLVPKLTVFVGLKDRFVDPSCTEVLAQRYGVIAHRHPDAGHDMCLDTPLWVLKVLQEELDQISLA
jgi:pimeloyl-ACP methyl ester carboxylesterase